MEARLDSLRRYSPVLFIAALLMLLYARLTVGMPSLPPGTGLEVIDRDVMIVIISGVILLASLAVILSRKYDDATQKWAFGAVGTILGYWLKP